MSTEESDYISDPVFPISPARSYLSRMTETQDNWIEDDLDDVKVVARPGEQKSSHHSAHASVSSYSWNVFRYIGDYIHAGAVCLVCWILIANRNCRGLSFKTQLFYLLIFVTRYLDMFSTTSPHSTYLLVFKLFYIASAFGIVLTMRLWKATIETNKDTCSIAFVVVPCLLVALISSRTSSHSSGFVNYCWTFSELMEGFAMLPQYIFTYRQEEENKRSDYKIFIYILLIGTYRVLYAVNWIYKKIMLGSAYHDFVSWIGGIIEIALFADFILNRSFLKIIVLGIDSRINVISKSIEMRVVPHNASAEDEIDAEIFGQEAIRKRKNQPSQDDDDEAMLMI